MKNQRDWQSLSPPTEISNIYRFVWAFAHQIRCQTWSIWHQYKENFLLFVSKIFSRFLVVLSRYNSLKLTPGGILFGVCCQNSCFQKSAVLLEWFISILEDAEFNFEKNGVTFKPNNRVSCSIFPISAVFDFSSAWKTYLKNKVASFVDRKVLYWMSLKRTLQYVGKYSEKWKTFCTVYYGPPVRSESFHKSFEILSKSFEMN